MINEEWIDNQLRKAKAVSKKEDDGHTNPKEEKLIQYLADECFELHSKNPEIPLGELIASAFDLVVSAEYYCTLGNKGWFYCPSPEPKYFYHFTNCCPSHALNNEFFFHPSSKPGSGNIGKATGRLLRVFLNVLMKKNNKDAVVLKGCEPVDVVIVSEREHKILFGEIKSSPLLTLPLAIDAEGLTDEEGNYISSHDSQVTLSPVFGRPISVMVPENIGNKWMPKFYDLGIKENQDHKYWAFDAFINLLEKDEQFLSKYYVFWHQAFKSYFPRTTDSIFWLTNGSGAPTNRPLHWPKSKGGEGNGYETVSDSKTSVGFDRTDDIKKGIYQVLKLGSEGKPIISKWDFKVGVVSNIHPARHFEEYLNSLVDLIWTLDRTGSAKKAGDLNPEHKLYNLFDGIIAFTQSHYRDEWLEKLFQYTNE